MFTDALLEQFDDGEPDPEEEKKVECTTCKKPITENSTFCAACGARQVAMAEGQEPDKPADEKAKAMEKLTEANKKLTDRLDEMAAKDKAREDKDACDKVITEALQDKPAKVAESVREMVGDKKLTPDTVKDIVESVQFRINAPFYYWRPQRAGQGRFALYRLLGVGGDPTRLMTALLRGRAGSQGQPGRLAAGEPGAPPSGVLAPATSTPVPQHMVVAGSTITEEFLAPAILSTPSNRLTTLGYAYYWRPMHQDVQLAGTKAAHHLVLLCRRHSSMK